MDGWIMKTTDSLGLYGAKTTWEEEKTFNVLWAEDEPWDEASAKGRGVGGRGEKKNL